MVLHASEVQGGPSAVNVQGSAGRVQGFKDLLLRIQPSIMLPPILWQYYFSWTKTLHVTSLYTQTQDILLLYMGFSQNTALLVIFQHPIFRGTTMGPLFGIYPYGIIRVMQCFVHPPYVETPAEAGREGLGL